MFQLKEDFSFLRFFSGISANLSICMTKSHKAIHFRVDMCDKSHILFPFKYIDFFLQIIKRVFYLLDDFGTNVSINFDCLVLLNHRLSRMISAKSFLARSSLIFTLLKGSSILLAIS